MTKQILIAGMLLLSNIPVFSQGTPPGFTHLKSGIDYKIVRDEPGTKKAKNTDVVLMHLVRKGNNTVLFDSRTLNNNEPVPYPISDPKYPGDAVEVFKLLTKGDSVVVRIPMDSLKKADGHMQDANYSVMEMYVSVVDIKTQEELKAEAEEKAKRQTKIDEKLITDYLAKNKIKAIKTASGLYYSITEPGEGEAIQKGQTAMVMYIGKLLDGSIFDANMGEDPKHTDPLEVQVGMNRVIKGWDEGLALLKKGSKATFFIPSTMAYGSQSPSPAIPPNSVMVFDVEIKDVR